MDVSWRDGITDLRLLWLKADDPTRDAESSKNEVRFKRAVGNEPALPYEVEWDADAQLRSGQPE